MTIKVVFSVSMNGYQSPPSMEKCILGCLKPMVPCLVKDTTRKKKIMIIAATLPGVEKISIEEEKNLLCVTGERIDTVKLVNRLRKKIGFATIVNQGEEEKEEKPADKNKKEEPVVIYNNRVTPMVEMWEIRDPYYNNKYSCFPFWW
ncbi:putative protein isoform X1 [Capsicum galapagoense]